LHICSLLILGGTTEASELALALSSYKTIAAILSLAGRTKSPKLPPIPYRIGGFGGIQGLTVFLRQNKVTLLIDATHPFAARMSHNAVEAAAATGIPYLAIRRPPWKAGVGDRWCEVATLDEAAEALGAPPKNVFLAIGRQELAPFQHRDHNYVIRSVERPDAASLPANATIITARGPFTESDERALLQKYQIDWLVAKNSGGVTGAKLVAARALSVPVIMVARPEKPVAASVPDVAGALAWIDTQGFFHNTVRGV
jgi:precorrin-6A/cobalt-precorrin-6A reductase